MIDFSDSLKKWGSDEFEEAVQMDLERHEADLPLDDFCEQGGGPDWESSAEFEIDNVEDRDDDIVVTTTVYFKESIPSGCRDINFTEARHGRFIIRIDKKSGRGEVEADRYFERRNLENY